MRIFNNKRLHEITITAVLSAALILLRFITYPILGISFATASIVFIAGVLSIRIAIYTGICHYLVTGAILGFGIWVLFQIIAVVVIAIPVYFIPKRRLALCIYSSAAAFLFSFVMLFSALPFVPLNAMPAYIIAGLPIDILNAVTNFVFTYILYRDSLIEMIRNYKRMYLDF